MTTPLNPPGYQQAGTYTAQLDRQYLVDSTFTPDAADPAQVRAGLLPGVEAWKGESSVAGLDVTISALRAVVPNTQQANAGGYLVVSTAPKVLSLTAASPTLNRIDLIGVQVQDEFYAGTVSDAQIVAIEGAPIAGTPAPPAAPANFTPLYEAELSAGATAPTLTDLRRNTAVRGGVIVPYTHEYNEPGSWSGEMRVRTAPGGAVLIEAWDGSAWITLTGAGQRVAEATGSNISSGGPESAPTAAQTVTVSTSRKYRLYYRATMGATSSDSGGALNARVDGAIVNRQAAGILGTATAQRVDVNGSWPLEFATTSPTIDLTVVRLSAAGTTSAISPSWELVDEGVQ